MGRPAWYFDSLRGEGDQEKDLSRWAKSASEGGQEAGGAGSSSARWSWPGRDKGREAAWNGVTYQGDGRMNGDGWAAASIANMRTWGLHQVAKPNFGLLPTCKIDLASLAGNALQPPQQATASASPPTSPNSQSLTLRRIQVTPQPIAVEERKSEAEDQ